LSHLLGPFRWPGPFFFGRQAAIRAGYSAKTAGHIASHLVEKKHIQKKMKRRPKGKAAKRKREHKGKKEVDRGAKRERKGKV